MSIEFPITVNSITYDERPAYQPKGLLSGTCGDMVAIRPCGEEHKGKTFLGIFIGQIALSKGCVFNKEKGELEIILSHHNPAIFVPDLDKVVFGAESWWGKIKDESQLREITNDDIQNVWYVKALKQIEEAA